ncbi:MAG TPA: hypothetical protein VLY65_00775 [Nitrososphaerales archaeon]|nr:hypothetical protein [Nitrososphaerales archaeon]
MSETNTGGERLEFCEECLSPLEDGYCHSCGVGFSDSAGPVGAAPLARDDLSKVLGRPVGARTHGSYALSMQQEQGKAPLLRQIDLLVDQFAASQEAKATAKRNAERLAVKIMPEVGPTKAAIACVAEEFLRLGRNLAEVSSLIANVHPRIDRLKDLVVEVYSTPGAEIRVVVDGRDRPFVSSADGLYRKLRIPVYVSDSGSLMEVKNAVLTRDGYDSKRVRLLGTSEFELRASERSFELFKILEEAKLSGGLATWASDPKALMRKYSISKLPLTEELLRATTLLPAVTAEYMNRLAERLKDGRGRSPKKLAEEALLEACAAVVPELVGREMAERYGLKPSHMRSLVVLPELGRWQG